MRETAQCSLAISPRPMVRSLAACSFINDLSAELPSSSCAFPGSCLGSTLDKGHAKFQSMEGKRRSWFAVDTGAATPHRPRSADRAIGPTRTPLVHTRGSVSALSHLADRPDTEPRLLRSGWRGNPASAPKCRSRGWPDADQIEARSFTLAALCRHCPILLTDPTPSG